jgi:hypothetical protein
MSYLSANKFIEPESFPTLRCYTVWLYRQIEKTYLFLDCAGRLLYPRKFILCHQKLQPSLMCYQNFQNSLCDITSNFLSPMCHFHPNWGYLTVKCRQKDCFTPPSNSSVYGVKQWSVCRLNHFGPKFFWTIIFSKFQQHLNHF